MLSKAKLRKLEKLLYQRAIDGDSKIGLDLLKLYKESIKDDDSLEFGVVALPSPEEPQDDI